MRLSRFPASGDVEADTTKMAVDLLTRQRSVGVFRQRHDIAVPRSNLETLVSHAIFTVAGTAGTYPFELSWISNTSAQFVRGFALRGLCNLSLYTGC